MNSGAGRRHQPPSPEQRQPRVAREKCSAGACPQLRARRSFARVELPGIPRRAPVGAIRETPWVARSGQASAGPAAWTDHHAPILSTTSAAWFSSLGVSARAGVDGLHEYRSRIAGSDQADGSQKHPPHPATERIVVKPRSRLDIPRGGLRRSVRYRPRNGIIMVHMFVFGHGAPRLTAVHLRVASLFKVVPQCGSNVKNTKQISWQARAGSLAKKVKLQNKDPDRPVPRPDECALHIG